MHRAAFCARSRRCAAVRSAALQADLEDAGAIAREVAGEDFDYVVHLAAISAVTHADELGFYRVNLFGTLNLLEALCALAPLPRKVILASSANIYGNSPASPITEDTSAAPVNHYAMSKLAMEHMSAQYNDRLPLVAVRPFNYTGVGQDMRFVVPKLVAHFRERRSAVELGNIDVEREFNDVRDICNVYLKLLEAGDPGEVYNICSGRTHRLRDVIQCLEALSGHSIDIRVNPAFVRRNEVHRLCGNPEKLRACTGEAPSGDLEATLRWMLESPGD
ncbi:MAG: GDP-mannose 4,6-dehydratase [Halioglobus sp.]|nr:GDP-mannose 4,6-dehydratase [Halioglobus sp.]